MKHRMIGYLIPLIILLGACAAPPTQPPATPTPASPPTADVPFGDLMTAPATYAGQDICTNGVYLSSFEVEALGQDTVERDGALYLTEPAIWLERAQIEAEPNCTEVGTPPAKFCPARVCGRFDYGGQYGHLNGWSYRIAGK
ncbi:MAG: hypothetical protein K1X65_09370 [Caldilineales bacterium]|nr:hypothetical protein [Caldilineales bacterium]MCW5860659.1 hypothetical protein [Caldilineales bacterium]